MGYGDELLGAGLARGAAERGVRIAFGDGHRILWGPSGEMIYRNNPNVARPGSEGASNLEWIHHFKHNRIYHVKSTKATGAWEYDPNFRATPGEIYFDKAERAFIKTIHPRFILIEPRVKLVYPNKQWPNDRYQLLARQLVKAGYRVCQFMYDTHLVHHTIHPGVKPLRSKSFRQALAMLSQASLFIGAEGGLGHGAAALGIKSVTIFGGFTDPKILGYPGNANLTGGAQPCGSLARCHHCKEAMSRITVNEVFEAAVGLLK